MPDLNQDRERLRCVVFDFDGVIADSMPSQERAWRAAARAVSEGVAVESILVRNLYAGHAGERMFDNIDLPEGIIARLRCEKDAVWEHERLSVLLFPGARDALEDLGGLFRMGIVTTAPRAYVEGVLGREGILEFFGSIGTDADARSPKPHPEILVDLLDRLGCTKEESLMVGDTVTDRELAWGAGVPFLHFDASRGNHTLASGSVRDWDSLKGELYRRASV